MYIRQVCSTGVQKTVYSPQWKLIEQIPCPSNDKTFILVYSLPKLQTWCMFILLSFILSTNVLFTLGEQHWKNHCNATSNCTTGLKIIQIWINIHHTYNVRSKPPDFSLQVYLSRSRPRQLQLQLPWSTSEEKGRATRRPQFSYLRFFLRSRPRQLKLPWSTSGRVHL